MRTFVIMRRDAAGKIFALFPEIPGSPKPAYCLCYSPETGYYGECYDKAMHKSRPASTREARPIMTTFRDQGYLLSCIQKASLIMHERRKHCLEQVGGRPKDFCNADYICKKIDKKVN